MSFQQFQDYYKDRRQFFQGYEHDALLKKAYIKLRKGSEIRFQDVDKFTSHESSTLGKILIDVPQIMVVKDRVFKSLETVEAAQEADVCIVYGDYGHGKSQTAHVLLESLNAENKEKRLVHLENISTFNMFMHNFGRHMKELIETQHSAVYPQVSGYIDSFLNIPNNNTTSHSQLIQTFVEFIQATSEHDIVHVVILDEVDKIVKDEVERKQWIDFFVTLNDESDLALLLICLIPQQMVEVLLSADRRLERWNHFFNVNATILDGKYSSEVVRAIASILALHDYYNSNDTSSKSLEFIFNIVEHKLEYLQTTSIRNVNTWVIIVGELFQQFEKMNLWNLVDSFSTKDYREQGEIIKSKLMTLFKADNLPQFELSRDDSEDLELYRTEFTKESLSVGNFQSDGYFRIYLHFMNSEKLLHEIPAMIEYVDAQPVNLVKIRTITDEYPAILIAVGSDADAINELKGQIKQEFDQEFHKYPIRLIWIPSGLVGPLLLLPDDDSNSAFSQTLQLLINWSNVITGHRNEISLYFQDLPTDMIRRGILLRSLELAKFSQEDIQTARSSSTSEGDKNKTMIFFAANIVSNLEEIQTFKYLNSIEKHVTDTVMTQFPGEALEIMQEFKKMIEILEDKGYIIKGGSKRVTIKKTESWDQIQAINLLKSIYSG